MLSISRQTNRQPEIFYSIQGEGITAGTPTMFLRLAFCNLRCDWCDTRYTWDWEHYNRREQVVELSTEKVLEHLLTQDCRRLVITGGEPLIQQKSLIDLMTYTKEKGFYIEIETNGTIVPDSGLAGMVDQWNVSPKLSNSGNPRTLREVPEAYAYFTRQQSSTFKYVIRSKRDLNEVEELIDKYGIKKQQIILMPEAMDRATLIERGKWLAEACKDRGYMFSSRLQILLWGRKRGV